MRITSKTLLHQQRQSLHTFAHVGVPHRNPHPRVRRDHRIAFSAAAANAGDADAKILSCPSSARSRTIAGVVSDAFSGGSSNSTAGMNAGSAWRRVVRRHW